MSELLEDAFKDEGEIKVYGEDIEQDKMICTDISANELPESKSNTVSFMKVEELSPDCRNLLAVSEQCICYSVTQKKNLLRLMDTVSGDKEILRGHDGAISDLKFSADGLVLCSTDNGATAGKPHTIIWKKNDGGITFQMTTQMMLKGTMLAAHPSQSNVWAISDKNSVGVFSSTRVNMNIPAKFAELSMSVSFEAETVTDIAFTPSGRHLIVALQNKAGQKSNQLQIFSIVGAGSDGTIKGNETLSRVFNFQPYSFDKDFYAESIIAVECVHQWIVTASLSTSGSTGTEAYCIHVWNNEGVAPTIVQTINLELPSFNSKINSTSLANPNLVCSFHSDLKNSRYLIFSSRKSSYVACLAVSPVGTSTVPLYHITYLNLKGPIVSMDVATILGRSHHSTEEGEHLEMSCYQEEASDQASVQQYHVLFSNLFDYEKYLNNTRRIRSRPVSQSNLSEFGVIGGPLKRLNSNDDSISGSSASSESKGKTILNFLNTANSVGIVAAPKAEVDKSSFSTPPVSTTTGLTAWLNSSDNAVLKPVGVHSTELPSFLNFDPPAKNTNILNMIKGNSGAPTPITPVQKTPPVIETPTIPAVTPNDKVTPVKQTKSSVKSEATKEKLLHVQEKVQILAKEHENSHHVETSSNSKSNKKAERLLNSFADDRSDVSSVGSLPKNLSTPTASSATAGFGASSIDLNGTPASMISSLADIKQAVRSIAKHAVTKETLDTVKDEVLKETKSVQLKTVEHINQSVKKLIESEVKKSVEAAFNSGKWKQEISSSIVEALQSELAPVVAQKVRDSVKDTVKDTVKGVLTTSFKQSFENTLVPSFQAGTERMFSQVQSSFENGMSGLVAEGHKYHQSTARSTEVLENEIRELKHTIHRLESTVNDLSYKLSHVAVANHSDVKVEESEPVEDAFSLLEKGLVSEAVLRALEDKDISVTISLLDRLNPTQVNSKCSNLVRLCITQQLAADMSVNIPEEGVAKRVEWIKNLVLSLVSGPSNAGNDPTYDRSFKSTIQLVLESIQSAKQLIFADNGEDGGLQVPQSVGTDLQLLEFVIQSKL